MRLDLDEGWCATLHTTIRHKRTDLHACCMGLVLGRKPEQRNLVFFRVKRLQPAMKGTSCVRRLRLRSFRMWLVPPLCSATSGCVCVRSSMRFLNLWLQIALEWLHDCCHLVLPCVWRDAGLLRDAATRIVMAAWMLHGGCVGEEAGARNLVFFRLKWLQPVMKGTSFVRRLRLRPFRTRLIPPLYSATSGCVCVRSSMRFLNLRLQISLEWLHDCCHLVLPCA